VPARRDVDSPVGTVPVRNPEFADIAGIAPDTTLDDVSQPADVMTVRRLFEPTAMSLVVAWATARDFAEMDRCLRGGERAADHDEFEVWDAALHTGRLSRRRVARCSSGCTPK